MYDIEIYDCNDGNIDIYVIYKSSILIIKNSIPERKFKAHALKNDNGERPIMFILDGSELNDDMVKYFNSVSSVYNYEGVHTFNSLGIKSIEEFIEGRK